MAQVRLVFNPVISKGVRDFPHEGDYFAYVEPLEPPLESIVDGKHVTDPGVGLYCVRRMHNEDKTRVGHIIKLKDIWRPVDLVPRFGKSCQRKWTASTSCEVAMEFFVNHYFDKESFEALYFD